MEIQKEDCTYTASYWYVHLFKTAFLPQFYLVFIRQSVRYVLVVTLGRNGFVYICSLDSHKNSRVITLTPCYTTLIRYFTFSNENVWWLCDSVKKKFPEEIQYCYCVYISNEQRAVRICKKKNVLIFKKSFFPLINLICIVLFLFLKDPDLETKSKSSTRWTSCMGQYTILQDLFF